MTAASMAIDAAAYEIDGKTATADDFYAVACNPARSVCVEACAGAGKTWMLIERIVNALGAGARPDEILAITFTKKAAGEMRNRLQERLASPDLAGLREQVIRSGRSVQVLNFHAWFGQLLKAAPLSVLRQMQLPLAYELLEDEKVLLPELRLAFYTQALARHDLQADLAALIETLGRSKVDDALVSLLAKRTEFELADQGDVLENSVEDVQIPDLDRELLWLTAKMLGSYKGKKQTGAATDLETSLAKDDVAGVFSALLTDKQKPRVLSSTEMDKSEGNAALLVRAQSLLQDILAAQHQHDCWLYQQRMTRVGRAWLVCFAKLKLQQGLVDMADLERAATTLLSSSDIASSVQERLDQRLRHVMIDEFQDTNPMQWQAMHAWLASYAGSGGGQENPSLFIVGDPKQSIYRFRRAEPRVFAAAQVFMQSTFDAALLSCDHTRRSSAAVLGVVNQAMGQAQQSNEYQGFRPHTTHSLAQGEAFCLPLIERARTANAVLPELVEGQDFDKLNPSGEIVQSDGLRSTWRDSLREPRFDIEESLKAREADQAARWIAAQAPQSTMVLARKNASLALIQQALQRYGVVSSLQEKQLLADLPVVQDVLALLAVLVSPHSDLDLARALMSPLFALTDIDLMALRALQLQALPVKKPWFELLDSEAYQLVYQQLLRWQSWLQVLPPHDALQAIYDDCDIFQRYPLQLHAALKALLWTALNESGGRFLGAYAFVRAMRAATQSTKAPAAMEESIGAASSAVQLLTIHGAKGLEADTVLLFDSDPEPRKSQSMTTLVDWQPDEAAPRKFVFLQSEASPPACAASLLAADWQARDIEELNTLYVAMTRARRTLVVSATKAYNSKPQSAWHRLNSLCVPASPYPERLAEALPVKPYSIRPAGYYFERTELTLPRFDELKTAIEAPSDIAKMGSALHRLLQWQSIDAASLAAVATAFELTATQSTTVRTQAECMLFGEASWLWDAAHIDWQANEYELLFEGRLLRIDRLVKHRESQMWWVIDFKSNLDPAKSDSLRQQLGGYKAAVSNVFGFSLAQIQTAFVAGDGRLVTL